MQKQSQEGFAPKHFDESDQESQLVQVLIVEKCRLIRSAIRMLIKEIPCIELAVETDHLTQIPDILVINPIKVIFININGPISLKEYIEMIKLTKSNYPNVGIIALFNYILPEIMRLFIDAGINSVLDDISTKEELESAINASISGNHFYLQRIYKQITSKDKFNQLTGSELQILMLLRQGSTNYHIAQQLYVTTKTIETHLTRIYKKLEVTSRAQAIIRAQELHLFLENTP